MKKPMKSKKGAATNTEKVKKTKVAKSSAMVSKKPHAPPASKTVTPAATKDTPAAKKATKAPKTLKSSHEKLEHSKAYHKGVTEGLKSGMSADEAKALGRERARARVDEVRIALEHCLE